MALNGSFYGGDLDLLRGPENQFPFPLTSDDKREVGGNLWLYLGGASLFAQYVDQDLGGRAGPASRPRRPGASTCP